MRAGQAAVAALLLLAACTEHPEREAPQVSASSPPSTAAQTAPAVEPAGAAAVEPQPASTATGAVPSAALPLSWPDPLPLSAPDVPWLQKGLLVGSWSAGSPADFETSWIDESALRVVFTGQAAGRRKWRGFASGGDSVPVDNLLKDREGGAMAYAYSLLSRPTPPEGIADEAAVLHVRHKGRLRAWWDGALVLDAQAPADGWAESRAPVPLTGPYDVLLLKVARGTQPGSSMDFSVRVSATDGHAIPDQAWKTMRPPSLPTDLPPAEAPALEVPADEAAPSGEAQQGH